MPKQISDEQILEAALVVIAERGFGGATTRQIASAAGVNEVTLFRRFGNKIGLLRTAMTSYLARFFKGGASWTGDLEADLERVVVMHWDMARIHGRLLPIFIAESKRYPELLEIAQVTNGIVADVAALLVRYQDEGALRREPAIEAASVLLGPIVAISLLQALDMDGLPEALAPSEYVRRYLDGRRA